MVPYLLGSHMSKEYLKKKKYSSRPLVTAVPLQNGSSSYCNKNKLVFIIGMIRVGILQPTTLKGAKSPNTDGQLEFQAFTTIPQRNVFTLDYLTC